MTPILVLPAFDLALLRRHDIDGCAGLLQNLERDFELRLFEAMGREDKHSLSFNGHVLHTSLSGI